MAKKEELKGSGFEPGHEPVELVRWVIFLAKRHGAVAFTYQVSDLLDSFRSSLPHIYFLGDRKFSRHQLPREHAEALGRCNEFLVKLGRPIILSDFLLHFSKLEPQLTKEIMGEARARGVEDQFMVPVFGPFTQNGVLTFAFPRKLDLKKDLFLPELEVAATTLHTRMVRHFGSQSTDQLLSPRENEVLNWMARGKTNAEIAIILGLSPSSIGTYVKRIFEKMDVHDRVSAAIKGMHKKLIS